MSGVMTPFLSLLLLFGTWSVHGQDTPDQVVTVVECPSGNPNCLRVGFTWQGTAPLQVQSQDLVDGYTLWAETVNQRGGIEIEAQNYTIELVGYDDLGDVALTQFYYNQLVQNNSVDFLLGPFGSSFTLAANNAANSLGKLVVFGSGTTDELFTAGHTMIFGISTAAKSYAIPALEALRDAGATGVSIIHNSQDTFANEVSLGAITWIATHPLSLVGEVQEYTVADNATLLPLFNNVKALNPDVLMFLGLYAEAEVAVTLAASIGLQPNAFFLTSAPSTPQFVNDLGSTTEFLLGTAQWHPSVQYSDSFFGTAQAYSTAYRSRFNTTNVPSYIAAQASAAGYILSLGLQNAASLTQGDVTQSLRALNVTTFYGPVAFNAQGKNIAKSMIATQVIDGQIEVVAPANQQSAALVYPIPSGDTTMTTSQSTTSSVSTTTETETSGTSGPNVQFPACVRVNGTVFSFSVEICVDVQFVECDIALSITVDNEVIFEPEPVSIANFREVFSEEERCQSGFLGCDVCTRWTNLVLNETEAGGCGELDIDCTLFKIGPFDLGCFENDEVVPRCFGGCEQDCNFNGLCVNGNCQCSPEWSGSSCNTPVQSNCPNNCGGEVRGRCVNNACVCTEKFSGGDCSVYIGEAESSEEGSDTTTIVIVVFVAVLAAVLGGAVYYWFVVKKNCGRKRRSNFRGLADSEMELRS